MNRQVSDMIRCNWIARQRLKACSSKTNRFLRIKQTLACQLEKKKEGSGCSGNKPFQPGRDSGAIIDLSNCGIIARRLLKACSCKTNRFSLNEVPMKQTLLTCQLEKGKEWSGNKPVQQLQSNNSFVELRKSDWRLALAQQTDWDSYVSNKHVSLKRERNGVAC